jgi:hypothetical protein
MAKSISVAVADRDTMRTGLALSVTGPLVPETVTGQWAAAAVGELLAALDGDADPPQAVRARSRARSSAESADHRGTGGVRDTGSLQKRRKTSPTSRLGSMRDPYREGR